MAHVGEGGGEYRVLEVKAKGKGLLEMPSVWWEDENKMDLKEIIWEGVDLIDLAESLEMWCSRKPGKPYRLPFLYFTFADFTLFVYLLKYNGRTIFLQYYWFLTTVLQPEHVGYQKTFSENSTMLVLLS